MAERIGPYEILGKLGSGGMGTVYRARDSRSDGLVALKVLKDEVAEDPELGRRFEQEANTLRRLDHENIVRLLEYGADGDAYYIAMELVEGESLAQRLRREGRLPEDEVRRIGIAVAAALEAAHEQRIIHRDIKPGNILLGADGSVKVSDFGVARVLDETRRTRTGTFLGSLAYAAPEAFDRPADERSDLYSLGIVLYECITGVVPFKADTPLRMLELQRWGTPDLSAMPSEPSLSAAIEHLLQKQPNHRPKSAIDVQAALVGLEAVPPVIARHDPDPTIALPRHFAVDDASSSSMIPPVETMAAAGAQRSYSRTVLFVLTTVGAIAVAATAGTVALARPFLGGGGYDYQAAAGPTSMPVVLATSTMVLVDLPNATPVPYPSVIRPPTSTPEPLLTQPTLAAPPTRLAPPYVTIVEVSPSFGTVLQPGEAVRVVVEYLTTSGPVLMVSSVGPYQGVGGAWAAPITTGSKKEVGPLAGGTTEFNLASRESVPVLFCGVDARLGEGIKPLDMDPDFQTGLGCPLGPYIP